MSAPTAIPSPVPARAVPGRTELGSISINDQVVAKIAARAALDVPDAGAAASRVLGLSLEAASGMGARRTSLEDLPKSSADVDGSLVAIRLSISVRWPTSVASVSQAVRSHVIDQVTALTGLHVNDVSIDVTALVTDLAPPPRVR